MLVSELNHVSKRDAKYPILHRHQSAVGLKYCFVYHDNDQASEYLPTFKQKQVQFIADYGLDGVVNEFVFTWDMWSKENNQTQSIIL